MSDKSTKRGPRRAQVSNACDQCRRSKVKCSGNHPTCSRCDSRGLACQYEVPEEGMTERQHLSHEHSDQTQELTQANAIFQVLRHGSDADAAETLAHLRLGSSIDLEGHRIQDLQASSSTAGPEALSNPQAAPLPGLNNRDFVWKSNVSDIQGLSQHESMSSAWIPSGDVDPHHMGQLDDLQDTGRIERQPQTVDGLKVAQTATSSSLDQQYPSMQREPES